MSCEGNYVSFAVNGLRSLSFSYSLPLFPLPDSSLVLSQAFEDALSVAANSGLLDDSPEGDQSAPGRRQQQRANQKHHQVRHSVWEVLAIPPHLLDQLLCLAFITRDSQATGGGWWNTLVGLATESKMRKDKYFHDASYHRLDRSGRVGVGTEEEGSSVLIAQGAGGWAGGGGNRACPTARRRIREGKAA